MEPLHFLIICLMALFGYVLLVAVVDIIVRLGQRALTFAWSDDNQK